MMREFQFDDMMPEQAITNQLWKTFDILRSEPLSSEDYHIVLFLLSLYRDGFLIEILSNDREQMRQSLEIAMRYAEERHDFPYREVYRTFENSFRRLSDRGFYYIIELLTHIDVERLRQRFPDFFDDLLYRIAKSQGRIGGEFIQPLELSRLVINLAELNRHSRVYNPFAGVASFGVFLEEGQKYFGQEINSATWAIGALRLHAHDKWHLAKYELDNSIEHWAPNYEVFDLVVANPPFGLRANRFQSDFDGYRNVEQFLIRKGIASLSETGKLIAILPNSFLFSTALSYQQLREYLLENDLIDTVISLPAGLLLNTGIPLTILVLNRRKRNPGMVSFVDAKEFVETFGSRERILNDYKLLTVIKEGFENKFTRIVSNDQVRALGYNLNVARYFSKEYEGVRLSDLVEFVRSTRVEGDAKIKLVRIRDLKDDKLDYMLDESSVEEASTSRPHYRMIHESALLLAIRWRTLKPTFFQYKGLPIALPHDIIALRVNEDVVNIGYLINELHADYVEEQLASYRVGETIPLIRRDDLMQIKVKLIPIKEQVAKMQGLTELSSRIKSLQEERNALAHGKSTSRFNEFASLKHTLGRPRQNILDWSDNLLDFLKGKTAEAAQLNKAFAEFYDIDMIAALQEIKRDINFMSEVLEKGENGLVLEHYPLVLLSFSELNALINHISGNGFRFSIKKLPITGEKKDLKERGIEANSVLLKTLIDNILTNANKHGFLNKEAANEVVIELREVEDKLILEIKNNGRPFSKNFDKEKFISKYSTANRENGTGLGGYDINRIAEYFNNHDWELVLNEDPIYPVKFKFQFPIKFLK